MRPTSSDLEQSSDRTQCGSIRSYPFAAAGDDGGNAYCFAKRFWISNGHRCVRLLPIWSRAVTELSAVLYEVIRSRLLATTEEMRIALQSVSGSPTVTDASDFFRSGAEQ